MKEMKDKILEIASIAKSCPDNLQAICFETLLKHYLLSLDTVIADSKPVKEQNLDESISQKSIDVGIGLAIGQQDELKEKDLHVKMRRFMQSEGITIEDINNLFYKEDGNILPIFDDLKTTRLSESQIRIALLQAVVNAFTAGEFQADVAEIRAECIKRKCYDMSNFTNNFKNNKNLFDFNKFDKSTKTIRLSESGKKELSSLLKELQ